MFRAPNSIALLLALAACSIVPEGGRQSARQAIGPAQPAYRASASERQCLTNLGTAQASFTPLPDKYYGAGCATLGTVQLSALHGDHAKLALGNLGPVACPLAESFAAWARYGVDRAARVVLGSALVRIETLGSYSCRDVAGTGRRSAHATAQAIDVAGFDLADGRRINVNRDWSSGSPAEREFLRIVHKSACKRFGTVLGPDYNGAHQDHFHLETSGSVICR